MDKKQSKKLFLCVSEVFIQNLQGTMSSDIEINENSFAEGNHEIERKEKENDENLINNNDNEEISRKTKKVLFHSLNKVISDECNSSYHQSLPLEGTSIFVDVRAENENRSKAISKEVEKLGGIVVPKINSTTTHVVFKNGRNGTVSQLKKYPHLCIVSVLWVDACKTTASRVDENSFIINLSDCTKENIIPTARAKRVKSLQPKTLEEDINNSAKKAERRRKLLRNKGKATGDTPPDQIICMDNSLEYIKSSDFHRLVATPRVIPDTPWILRYINTPEQKDQGNSFNDPSDKSFDTDNKRNDRVVIKNLIRTRDNENDSPLLRKSFHPTRLSIEFSNVESPEFISPTQKVDIRNELDLNSGYVFENSDISIESGKSDNQENDHQSNPTNNDSNLILERIYSPLLIDASNVELNMTPDLTKSKECFIVVDNAPISDNENAEEVSKSNNESVREKQYESMDLSKSTQRWKKKKVLFTQTAPFADSPLGDGLDILPRDIGTYRKMNTNGKQFDQYNMIHNVNTSRIIPKVKEPTVQSKQNDNQDSNALVLEMHKLNVNKCMKRGKKGFLDKQCTKSLRRSSGIDFKTEKIRKEVTGEIKNNSNKLTETKESKFQKILNSKNKHNEPIFSDSSSDTESIASDCSFIHDENKGLIVCLQEEYRKTKLVSEDSADVKQPSVDCTSKILDVQSVQKTNSSNINIVNKPKRRTLKTNKLKDRRSSKPLTKKNTSLVSTSLHFSEQTFLKHVLKELGGFKFRTNVANDTTHVVAGSGRRTLNILHAVVNGCWILSPKWISDSAESGKWLKETIYEMVEEFPMSKINRISEQNGHSILRNLFLSSPPLYIADGTSPPSDELVKLVSLCGGQITNSIRKAEISVGCVRTQRHKKLCTVTEKWILDSIWEGKVLPTKSYELCVDENFRVKSPDF